MPGTVFGLLEGAARDAPDATAIHYGGAQLTWRELADLARRAAGGLAALGVGEGDRVAFWLPNTVAYVAAYFACAQLGAVSVAVNTRYRAKEVADIVGRSGAKVLILWPGFRGIDFLSILQDVPNEALSRLEHVVLYGEEGAQPDAPAKLAQKSLTSWSALIAAEAHPVDAGSPSHGCNMFTTSGTTSAPKFVFHEQRSIVQHAEELRTNMAPLIRDGALLQTLPFCGVFGFTSIVLAVAAKKQMVITSAFDARETIRLVDAHNVRYFSATDDMVMAMLDADSRPHAMPGLTAIGFGAFNASPEELAERAGARGVRLLGLYGMSEVMALYARRDPKEPDDSRVLGGGHVVSPGADVRVRHPDTGELCPHGESGELEIRGPSLMAGYFENPQATAAAFTDDGYLRTGDLGYTTGEGEFVYLTRMGDTLRLGGFLVSPVEIEAHLAEHPNVEGAQVVSVRIGDTTRAYAFVVTAEGQAIDASALGKHCADALARFKVPIAFQALDAFPTTKGANGTKIQRARLRDMAQAAVDEGEQ